ncbi:MAG: hypothetical protein RDV48_22245 [Candidatus Eremiobacteraeota bacterium]|nr:hypothetical protein [Candidatus Eremiobacteraeota bacterium]
MDFQSFFRHIAPFKIYAVIVIGLFTLSEYYISFMHFSYAAKKEDSPANLNAATLKGFITLAVSIALTALTIWLAVLKWK